jgi:hypothetical protein
MSFFGAIKSGLAKVGIGAVKVITYPIVKPTEVVMGVIIKNTLISLLKGVLATIVTALGAMALTPPASNDAATAFVWGLIITGIHALQTIIQHLIAVNSTPTPAK